MQSDPIGLYGGVSTYSYAASNALTYIDTFGLVGGRGPVDLGAQGVGQYLSGQPPAAGSTRIQEVTLEVTGVGRTRLDIGELTRSRVLDLTEVKFGPGARINPNQKVCFAEIANGNFIPRGQNAADLGLTVGVKGGGTSGVKIKVAKISGAGAAAIIMLIPSVAEAATSQNPVGGRAQAIFSAVGEGVLCGFVGGCGAAQ